MVKTNPVCGEFHAGRKERGAIFILVSQSVHVGIPVDNWANEILGESRVRYSQTGQCQPGAPGRPPPPSEDWICWREALSQKPRGDTGSTCQVKWQRLWFRRYIEIPNSSIEHELGCLCNNSQHVGCSPKLYDFFSFCFANERHSSSFYFIFLSEESRSWWKSVFFYFTLREWSYLEVREMKEEEGSLPTSLWPWNTWAISTKPLFFFSVNEFLLRQEAFLVWLYILHHVYLVKRFKT